MMGKQTIPPHDVHECRWMDCPTHSLHKFSLPATFKAISQMVSSLNDDELSELFWQLVEDKERLDWLERNTQWSDPHHRMKVTFPMETVKFITLREAIDAALAKAKI